MVFFRGELDLAGADLARQALVELTGPNVMLDLSGLTFLDVSGLRAIVSAKQRADATGGALRIQGARGSVRRVFDLTGLAHLLEG